MHNHLNWERIFHIPENLFRGLQIDIINIECETKHKLVCNILMFAL